MVLPNHEHVNWEVGKKKHKLTCEFNFWKYTKWISGYLSPRLTLKHMYLKLCILCLLLILSSCLCTCYMQRLALSFWHFLFWGGGRHKTLEQRSRYKMSFTRYHFKVGCLVDEGLFKLIVGSVKLGIFFCSGKRG